MPTQNELYRTFSITSDRSRVFEQYLSFIGNDISNDSDHHRSVFCYNFPMNQRYAIRDIIDTYCATLGR